MSGILVVWIAPMAKATEEIYFGSEERGMDCGWLDSESRQQIGLSINCFRFISCRLWAIKRLGPTVRQGSPSESSPENAGVF